MLKFYIFDIFHFFSGSNSSSGGGGGSGGGGSSGSGTSSLRESVDPIAELLSQLSGVRRAGTTSSQLQQLQVQLQLERQQVCHINPQLSFLPLF